jgi:hypothetical protein
LSLAACLEQPVSVGQNRFQNLPSILRYIVSIQIRLVHGVMNFVSPIVIRYLHFAEAKIDRPFASGDPYYKHAQ